MKILSITLLLFLHSCVSTDNVKSTGVYEIQFGSGGGFAGKTTTYSLNTKGKLTLIESQNKFSKKLTKRQTEELFTLADKLKHYTFNKPDNLYSFITIKTNDTDNRIVWGFGSQNVDTNAATLFDKLITQTK